MSQAEVARPAWGRASRRAELRRCLGRKGPDHLTSGHPGTRFARMSRAKVAGPPWGRASPSSELRG
eukprot:7091107-Pyramimonas_sp.AAC.1